MKASVLEQAGGPEQLVYRDFPDPSPGPGEVVVRLKAAGLNHRDLYSRRDSTNLPIIIGSDGAGTIEAVGTVVTDWQPGAEVIINPSLDWPSGPAQPPGWRILGVPDNGTYAELVKLPAANAVAKPATLDWAEAASVGLGGLTAWRALTTRGQLKAGETVVVLGIGGGVATILVQMAKLLGARVIITSSSDEKLARGKELGADEGINYRSSDWVAEVKRLTDGQGAEMVIDSTGQQTWPESIRALRPAGRLVFFGSSTGSNPTIDIRYLFSRQLSLLGTMMGNGEEFAAMLQHYADGKLRPIISHHFPLSDAAAAHRLLESEQQFGKIVLDIAP